ncbi:MAG TPA: hypothetical protein VJY36_01350 [Candidatus Bathyarchaeia archaeon]|nr:hypothetical protein [Candidatus Bathyarchaeia archaeon]
MSRKTTYFLHSLLFFAVLVVLLGAAVALIFFGAASIAFSDVGFTSLTIMLLLICTLVGSFINIPLLKLRATIPMIRDEYVTWYSLPIEFPG